MYDIIEKELSKLNREQLSVATYNDEKFLSVEAGPGSGKTRVLIEKVRLMIFKGVKPESILIITFSKRAAEELQTRLINGGILKSDVQKMQISTIHSFCLKILEDAGEVVFDVLEDEKENMFIGKHLKELGFENEYYLPNSQIKDLIRKYHEYSTFNVDTLRLAEYIESTHPISEEYIEFVRDYIENNDSTFPRSEVSENDEYKQSWHNARYLQIAKSYTDYLELLQQEHVIDFGLMQYKALDILKDNSITKYTNILIDEFQDTDPVQMDIFEQLMKEAKSFTVVGDINQSIYGFRGSSKNYFDYLKENYPDDFEFKYLKTNYRSTEEIIDFCDDFITHHQRNETSKAICGRKDNRNNNIYYLSSEDAKSEAENIFNIIKYLKSEGKIIKYSDIGILTRSVKGKSRCISNLIQLLIEDNIPYQIKGLGDLAKRDEIKSILTLMFHLVEDDNPHSHILNRWQKDWLNLKAYTGENFNQVLFNLSDETKTILNNLQDNFEEDIKNTEKEVYFEYTGKKSRLRSLSGVFNRDEDIVREIFRRVEKPILSDDNLIKYGVSNLDDLNFFKKLNELKYQVSSEDVEFYNRPKVSEVYLNLLCDITGFLTEDVVNSQEEIVNNLAIITNTLSNFEDMRYERDFRGLFWFIYRTIEEQEAYLSKNDGVQIMTVHKSKGLEFPVTILASLGEGIFPMKFKEQNPENGFMRGVGYVYYTPAEFLGYPKFDGGDDVENLSGEEYSALEKKSHQEEEERIIYVAVTRAKDTLILSSILKDGKMPEVIEKTINNNSACCSEIDVNNLDINTFPDINEDRPDDVVNLSFTALENYLNCPFMYKLANQINFNISQQKAVDEGILIHKAFEIINKQIKSNNNEYIGDEDVSGIVESLFKKSHLALFENNKEKYDRDLQKAVSNVLYYYQNYGKNLKILDSEYPFYIKEDDYVLSGIIDLIYERDGKLGIIDYKNTALERKYSESHKKQLHLYVLALRDQNQEYVGKTIEKLEIYAVKSKRLVEIDFDEDIIIQLKKDLSVAAKNIKLNNFESRKCGECKNCPYSKICA